MDGTLVVDRVVSEFSISWRMNWGGSGLSLQLEPWSRREIVGPTGRVEAFAIFKLAPEMAAAEQRLEFRDSRGHAFTQGPWAARNFPLVAALRWGHLQARLREGGAEVVIVDRSGRVLAREPIGAALLHAPELGLELARGRWNGVVGNREQRCPDGTMPMQEVFVAD